MDDPSIGNQDCTAVKRENQYITHQLFLGETGK